MTSRDAERRTRSLPTTDQLDAEYDSRPQFDVRLRRSTETTAKQVAKSLLRLALGSAGYLTRTHTGTGSGALDTEPVLRTEPAWHAEPVPRAETVRRILVVRVDLLGDVVLSLPAVRLLARAYPGAQIDMLVQKSTAAILEGQPGIHRVLAYDPHIWRRPSSYLWPPNWQGAIGVFRTMRAANYDLAVSISGDMGSILTRISGATRRYGYAKEAYPYFLTHPLPGGRYLTHKHEVQYVLALAEAAAGIPASPQDAAPTLLLVPAAVDHAEQVLRRARQALGRSGPVVALHGGARNGQAKRWPTGHFAELAERLIRDFDALVVLTGAGNEAPLAEAIAAKCRYPLLNLVGRTSLPQLAAILAAGELVISGDSGPMHVAGAVGTPVISLHGPTDPELSGPVSERGLVLRRALWCSPCYDASATAECPFGNPVCMKELKVDTVLAAARRMLRRTGSSEPAAHTSRQKDA